MGKSYDLIIERSKLELGDKMSHLHHLILLKQYQKGLRTSDRTKIDSMKLLDSGDEELLKAAAGHFRISEALSLYIASFGNDHVSHQNDRT